MYEDIIIETFIARDENSKERVRARPFPGQGYSKYMRVECSTVMRKKYPVGTKFKIRAHLIDREGAPFLYTHYQWPFSVVTTEEAEQFVKGKTNPVK
jgi:hypothetical protein